MALADNYVQVTSRLPEFFKAIQEGEAPAQFTRQHLADLGFAGSGFRAVIPLLKTLGFLSETGEPTKRYHDFRDPTQSRRVLGEALREAYADLFLIKSSPTEQDRPLFEGKFRSTHNVNERLAKLMAGTFFALLAMADVSDVSARGEPIEQLAETKDTEIPTPRPLPLESLAAVTTGERRPPAEPSLRSPTQPSLHYNIEIHLPATKDVEVFNAIFKSLKEHLLA